MSFDLSTNEIVKATFVTFAACWKKPALLNEILVHKYLETKLISFLSYAVKNKVTLLQKQFVGGAGM